MRTKVINSIRHCFGFGIEILDSPPIRIPRLKILAVQLFNNHPPRSVFAVLPAFANFEAIHILHPFLLRSLAHHQQPCQLQEPLPGLEPGSTVYKTVALPVEL